MCDLVIVILNCRKKFLFAKGYTYYSYKANVKVNFYLSYALSCSLQHDSQ